MNKYLLVTSLSLIAALSSACSFFGPSTFYSTFSLQQIVESNKNQLHVSCTGSNGGGGGGISAFSRSLSRAYQYSKSVGFGCTKESDAYDQDTALPMIQRAVEQAILSSGGKVTSRENPPSKMYGEKSFILTYTINGAEGKLKVSSSRFSFGQITFNSDLDESRK